MRKRSVIVLMTVAQEQATARADLQDSCLLNGSVVQCSRVKADVMADRMTPADLKPR
jgi:hypothetical protein